MTATIHPPAIACHFMCFMDLVYWRWRAGTSGLNTEPASLLPPASDSRYRFCLRIQLLTPPASQARALRAGCWLRFSQVGLSRTRFRITHWVTITHFMGFLPIPRSRIYLGTMSVLLAGGKDKMILFTCFTLFVMIPKFVQWTFDCRFCRS